MGLKSKHVAPDETTLRSIEKNVELVKNHFSEQLEVELDFNPESIEWIDGYINRNREKLDSDTVDNLSNIFGSFWVLPLYTSIPEHGASTTAI